MAPAIPADAHGLEALQADFVRHLLDQPSGFAAAVAEGGRIGIERRLAIYCNAYRARLVDALRDGFGHTARYLGDEGFEAAAHAYLAVHPSAHPNLRWFGSAFPAWLAAVAPSDPDIGELAGIDWALRRAFDGPDADVLTLPKLAAVPPEAWNELRLCWHPTCHRIALRHNALAIWHALDQDQTPPDAQALDTPTELIVWRRDLQPHFRSLGRLEAAAIDRLMAGVSFAATCEALAEQSSTDVAAQAGAMLRRWIEEGLLSGVDTAAR